MKQCRFCRKMFTPEMPTCMTEPAARMCTHFKAPIVSEEALKNADLSSLGPGDIIPVAEREITASQLRAAFEEVVAARELLVEAVSRFQSLLDSLEDSKDA